MPYSSFEVKPVVEIYHGQKIHIAVACGFAAFSSPFDLPIYACDYEIYINNRKISTRIKELAETVPRDKHNTLADVYLDIAKQLIDKKIQTKLGD